MTNLNMTAEQLVEMMKKEYEMAFVEKTIAIAEDKNCNGTTKYYERRKNKCKGAMLSIGAMLEKAIGEEERMALLDGLRERRNAIRSESKDDDEFLEKMEDWSDEFGLEPVNRF